MNTHTARPRVRADRKRSQKRPRSLQSTRLQFEPLEARELMSAIPITDMTQWVQQFPRHAGPTVLSLNFDGFTSQNVQAFSGTDQDIQDVLFRTAEIFAPFDVQVRRITGNGNVDTGNGNTTVFIGDDSDNGTGTKNASRAWTPWSSADWPGTQSTLDHKPNGNPFDVAFVDPVWYNPAGNITAMPANIAQSIAHEAGHTFGLVHVHSSPVTDMMSYNSANVAFRNQAFTITTDNFTGTSVVSEPGMRPYSTYDPLPWFKFYLPITTQNSYSYLAAALGTRSSAGDLANVADTTTVDPAYVNGTRPTLALDVAQNSTIDRVGDYDVFRFVATSNLAMRVDVQRLSGSTLNPVVYVYSDNGSFLWQYNNDRATGIADSQLVFQPTAGTAYNIVVGAWNGATQGQYSVKVTSAVVMAVLSPPPKVDWYATITRDLSTATRGAGAAQLGQWQAGVLERSETGAVDRIFAASADAGSVRRIDADARRADAVFAGRASTLHPEDDLAALAAADSWTRLTERAFALGAWDDTGADQLGETATEIGGRFKRGRGEMGLDLAWGR